MTASYNLSLLGSNYNQGGTGAVARTTASKLQEKVSVKDFGAVGDGTTDDTAAINAAIAACVNGKTVFFPNGNYKITASITLPSNTTLMGDGRNFGTTITPVGCAAFVVDGTVVVGGIKGNEIEQAIELAIAIKENNEPSALIPDYTDVNVSIKVIKIIQSFTSIVNKVVWGK